MAKSNNPGVNMRRIIESANRWRDSHNPLRQLDMPRAVQLMELAQRGIMADLQWLYAAETGIEATDPDLMVIIERTVAGVSDCEWQIETVAEGSVGYDPVLAEAQAAFLRESFARCDNLEEAIEHLVMARFRGFAHLQPWLLPDWTIEHLEPLPQWNMVRNGTRSDWAWNPKADSTDYASLKEGPLSPSDYILLDNRRPVNRIALIKYIRASTAEKDWDGYVEIYGIPGVFIIMPERVPDGKEEEYAEKAEEAAEAASGALPAGSDVKTLSEARGSQPFQMRLEWLQKQLVLAGTGGLLTMLAEAGSGTLAGGAHQEAWDQIVRRTARTICRPINRQYVRPALAARFPGRPALATFELRVNQEKDASDVVANVLSLTSAGFRLDPAQVERETGYTILGFEAPAATAAPWSVAKQLDPLAKRRYAVAKRTDGFGRTIAAPSATPPENGQETALTAFRSQPAKSGELASAQDALLRSGSEALAAAQAAANRPLALGIASVLTAQSDADLQAAARKLRDALPGIAKEMAADPSRAEAYHKILSTAFLQGILQQSNTETQP